MHHPAHRGPLARRRQRRGCGVGPLLQSLEERARAVVSRTGEQHSRSEWQRCEECRYRRESRGEGDAESSSSSPRVSLRRRPVWIAPASVANVAAVAVGGGERRGDVERTAGHRRAAGDDSEGLGVPLPGLVHHLSIAEASSAPSSRAVRHSAAQWVGTRGSEISTPYRVASLHRSRLRSLASGGLHPEPSLSRDSAAVGI